VDLFRGVTYIRRVHDFEMATSKGVAAGKRQRKPKYSVQETLFFLPSTRRNLSSFALLLAKGPQQHIGRCQLHAELSTPVEMRGGHPCCRMLNIRGNNVRIVIIPSLENR
jgi:hypothetical protein